MLFSPSLTFVILTPLTVTNQLDYSDYELQFNTATAWPGAENTSSESVITTIKIAAMIMLITYTTVSTNTQVLQDTSRETMERRCHDKRIDSRAHWQATRTSHDISPL